MYGLDACTVENLLTAGGAGGCNDSRNSIRRLHCLTDSREENHLANSQRGFIVFLFIPEGAGHAAAARRNDMHFGSCQQLLQDLRSLINAYQGLLMAVTM